MVIINSLFYCLIYQQLVAGCCQLVADFSTNAVRLGKYNFR
jgi:hypothetical protein